MLCSLSLPFSLSHMELINILYKKKIGGNGLGAKRLGLGGGGGAKRLGDQKGGETTRGEPTRGETSLGRNVLLP